MIPKHMHFYWGKEPMPELCAYAPISFKIMNPEWTVTVHTPKNRGIARQTEKSWDTTEHAIPYTGGDYFPFLTAVVKGNDNTFSIKEETFPEFLEGCHDIHESDYLRLRIMAEEGGFWSDCDILYNRHAPDFRTHDLVLCHDTFSHLIGFYGCTKGHPFFQEAFLKAKKAFSKKKYQSIGAELLNSIELPDTFYNIHPIRLYPQHVPSIGIIPESVWVEDWCFAYDTYDKLMDKDTKAYKNLRYAGGFVQPGAPGIPAGFGVHWYGGNLTSRLLLNDFDKYKDTIRNISRSGIFHNYNEYDKILHGPRQ